MRIVRLGSLCCFGALLVVTTVYAQQSSTPTTPTRDPQAISILTQCLTTAGGIQAVSAIQDFTETGNITYLWAGQQDTGTVTVRGLGVPYFRLDADLQEGVKSWLVNGSQGSVKNPDGSTTQISYANAVNRGSLVLPYLPMLTALNDSSFSITMIGTTTVNGRQATQIQIQQSFSATDDPTGDLTKFNTKTYIIDSQTFTVLETQDTLWSDDGRMKPISHEIDFSNFTTTHGLAIPLSVVESMGGQQTWTMQISNVTFNSGLTTDVFQF